MPLIDTNIAIFLQNRNFAIRQRLAELNEAPLISLVTLVELEGGIAAQPDVAPARRLALASMLRRMRTLPLDDAVVAAYAHILETTGFSRSRILDRLIAATAIVHDMTLVTANGPDFTNIPGLKLEIWPRPPQ